MKHVNYPTTMDWISAMWSMIKILLSVWPLTCIYIHIELCMMLFYFICHRKYCFIQYSFTYMYTYLFNQVPGWHPRARPWAHLKLLLQYKTLSLWVLGGWTSHLGLFNICWTAHLFIYSSFKDTGILPNNMRSPSPECYTTFWMTTYSDTLHW